MESAALVTQYPSPPANPPKRLQPHPIVPRSLALTRLPETRNDPARPSHTPDRTAHVVVKRHRRREQMRVVRDAGRDAEEHRQRRREAGDRAGGVASGDAEPGGCEERFRGR